MARATLKESSSLAELAEAAELLSHLERVGSDSAKGPACKRIGKLDFDAEDTPSSVYHRAQLFNFLKCDTLSGVKKQVDELLEGFGTDGYLSNFDYSELYYAYLLGKENGASHIIDKNFASIAIDTWLPNFNPSKWTLKEHITYVDHEGETVEKVEERALDGSVVQIAEILATLIPNKKCNKKTKAALDIAFPALITKVTRPPGKGLSRPSNVPKVGRSSLKVCLL